MVTKGMLWYDNSQTALPDKVQKAADYYQKKHGIKPTVCLIHPTMGHTEQVGDISVRVYKSVSPGHLWLAIEDDE